METENDLVPFKMQTDIDVLFSVEKLIEWKLLSLASLTINSSVLFSVEKLIEWKRDYWVARKP